LGRAANCIEKIELERVLEILASAALAEAAPRSAAEEISEIAEDVLEARVLSETLPGTPRVSGARLPLAIVAGLLGIEAAL
jgi:hypothetical protein